MAHSVGEDGDRGAFKLASVFVPKELRVAPVAPTRASTTTPRSGKGATQRGSRHPTVRARRLARA